MEPEHLEMLPLKSSETDDITEEQRMELNRIRWKIYVPASCALLFFYGTSMCFSFFSTQIKLFNPTLVSVYTSALGFQAFTQAFTMIGGAYYMSSQPYRVQSFALFSAALNMFMIGAAYGIQTDSHLFIIFSLGVQGLAMGGLYIVGVEQIAQWLTDRTGAAMALGMGSLSSGAALGGKFFTFLIDITSEGKSSPAPAICALSVILVVVPSIVSYVGAHFPPRNWDPRTEEEINDSMEVNPDMVYTNDTGCLLGWKLLLQPQFYMFLVNVAIGSGPCFGIIAAFPTVLNEVEETDATTATNLYSLLSIVGLITRFTTGFLVDQLNCKKGLFWSGGKNLMLIVQLLQGVAGFFIMSFFEENSFEYFFAFLGCFFITYNASAVLTAILSRQIFAPVNAGIVFGYASGVMDGLASMLFSMYMASLQDKATYEPSSMILGSYFKMCLFGSCVSVCCALFLTRCEKAFEVTLQDGNLGYFFETDVFGAEECKLVKFEPLVPQDVINPIPIIKKEKPGGYHLVRGVSLKNCSYSLVKDYSAFKSIHTV